MGLKLFASVKINDSTYMDETEVDVKAWLSFYSWTLEHQGLEAAQELLPDSVSLKSDIWVYIKTKTSIYNSNISSLTTLPVGYFLIKCDYCTDCDKELSPNSNICTLLSFPITGISYNQVLLFCKWRTEIQGENKVVYRLPTEKEWKVIALKGFNENEKIKGIKDSICSDTCLLYNFKSKTNKKNIMHSIGRYAPDKNNLFDLFGNVSEMTSEKGISKGGNYLTYANQCHPDSVQRYSEPEIWLGFRCLRIIKK
jgi:formylglycine-generating enzyme required for sulfatase activity